MATVGVKYRRNADGQLYLTADQLQKKWSKLTKDEKIETLYEALDFMNQYNGRTRFQCIAMAMGYEIDYVDNGDREEEVWIKRKR